MDRSAPTIILALVSVSLLLLPVNINKGIAKRQFNPNKHHSKVRYKTSDTSRSVNTTNEPVSPFGTRGAVGSMLSLTTERTTETKAHLHPLPEQNIYSPSTLTPIDLLIPPPQQQPDR
jgi:hypothetical protein